MDLKIALHSFAREVFREQADRAYITAQDCYRLEFREQFLWASQQACEKYLKGILLFNQRSARFDPATYNPSKKHNKEFGHDLSALFTAVQAIGDLPVDQATWLPSFLEYLTKFGNNRYLSTATYALGNELRKLDEAVWRFYAGFARVSTGRRITRTAARAKTSGQNGWRKSATPNTGKTQPLIGRSEPAAASWRRVLKRPRSNPARQALVWNNMFFSKRQRHTVTYSQLSSSENPPQTRDWFNVPAISDVIEHYIRL